MKFPLVVMPNADRSQVQKQLERQKAPFDKVLTSTSAHANKRGMQTPGTCSTPIGCGPEDVVPVSWSVRYGRQTAHGVGIEDKVWVCQRS